MPAKCTICAHNLRGDAEALIANGHSVRNVAKGCGLSYQSLDRHARNCVPKAIAKAAAARDAAFADSLMTEVELLHRTTLDVLRESRQGKWLELPDPKDPENNTIKIYDVPNVKNSIRAIAEARKNLALIARLTGQLEPKHKDGNRTITFEEFEVLYMRTRQVAT